MPDVRQIPGRLNGMAAACTPGSNAGVFAATKLGEEIVQTEGGVYRLTGRRQRGNKQPGKKVSLSATSNVRDFAKKTVGEHNVVGIVKGVPAGFWSIVEKGHRGGYIIANRDATIGRASGAGKTRGLATKRERRAVQQNNRILSADQGRIKGPMIWIPAYNAAFPFVRGGRAGPQGRPWSRALSRSKVACPKAYEREHAKPVVHAFRSTAAILNPSITRYRLPIGRSAMVARTTYQAPVAP